MSMLLFLGIPSVDSTGKEVKQNMHARPMIFEVLQSKGASHRLKYSQGL